MAKEVKASKFEVDVEKSLIKDINKALDLPKATDRYDVLSQLKEGFSEIHRLTKDKVDSNLSRYDQIPWDSRFVSIFSAISITGFVCALAAPVSAGFLLMTAIPSLLVPFITIEVYKAYQISKIRKGMEALSQVYERNIQSIDNHMNNILENTPPRELAASVKAKEALLGDLSVRNAFLQNACREVVERAFSGAPSQVPTRRMDGGA